ncbi:MAG: hypothetical protein RQ862_00235 [Candidatus Caldarchaeales archaeon]|jgi:hypothetical protein|nr:hypothetical protein [Candidatus Caldarchaeales archaeon]
MKMKAVNRKPVIRPEGTLALQGGEEVSKVTVGLPIVKRIGTSQPPL